MGRLGLPGVLALLVPIAALAGRVAVEVGHQLGEAKVMRAKQDLRSWRECLIRQRFDTDACAPARSPQDCGTPALDPWGAPYRYRPPAGDDPDAFQVWSLGADGRPGGRGEDTDLLNP